MQALGICIKEKYLGFKKGFELINGQKISKNIKLENVYNRI